MATETATLIFRADTSALRQAERRLRAVENQGSRTEASAKNVGMGFKGAAVGAAALAAAIGAISKIVSVATEFDVINASLKTMTGSTERAKMAFAEIQKFATETPYDLAQVATSFTKLKARGLDPSMDALRSYGNTASAMGKSLDQMIEAVADATTGEFERLKEFGIKASKEGDKASLTFKGVTTTIGTSAGEIEQYLRNIGNVEFGGAMAERAETLDGKLSNLGDSWDGLWLTISNSGLGELFKETAEGATLLINAMERTIRAAQGQLTTEEQINDLVEKRKSVADEAFFAANAGNAELEAHYDKQLAQIDAQLAALKEKNKEEEKVIADNNAEDQAARELAAENEKNNKLAADKKEFYDKNRQRAEDELQAALRINQTELEASAQKYDDLLAQQKNNLELGLISQEEFENAKTELILAKQRERLQILEEMDRAKFEADMARWAEEAEAELAVKKDKEAQEAQATAEKANAINAIEDTFMKNVDARKKASFRLAMSLADAEKRAKAKEIIVDSYSAAMKAYQSLAAIPVVGPALGAAAFAATIAMGVQAAGQAMAGRALGGQVRAGESYVVGERGPEILTMGGNGKIIPNEQIKGSSQQAVTNNTNVSFSIVANDTDGFDDLLESRRGSIVSMINQALNEGGKVGLV